MTKAELVSQAYLRITNGYPNTDLSTWYDDVDLLLAPAVNFVLTKQYFIEKADEGSRIIQPLLLQTYTADVGYDDELGLYKIVLPKKPIALPNGRGITFIGTFKGQSYIPIGQNGGSMQKYYCKHKKGQGSYELVGMEALLHNHNVLNKKLKVRQLVDASELNDDDEIMLPSGSEFEVMDLMIDFFLGQRELPKDYLNTGKEGNSVVG